MRNIARQVAEETETSFTIDNDFVINVLGKPKFNNDLISKQKQIGVVVGLAWTYVGGDILFIETSKFEGKGGLTLTGNLGNVMKESATTALSFIQANAKTLGIPTEAFTNNSLHVHVPEGATPKDGPSAGITMLTSMVSAFTNKPVKPQLAMTGEITLRGQVLPVGGIKEKILAAKRAGIKEIILCTQNEKDILEIPERYIKGLKFYYVDQMMEVLEIALG